MADDWIAFLRRARPSLSLEGLGLILCLDPGETTGWALFCDGDLIECGQEYTDKDPALMAQFIASVDYRYKNAQGYGPLTAIVYEEYRVRAGKFNEHVGSEVVTIQHIGAIKVAAELLLNYTVPLFKQSAADAKSFSTDEKLKEWGLWQSNQRHANDAIRHGTRHLLWVAGRERPARGKKKP